MNQHSGSSFESLFEETGDLDEVRGRALKKGFVETVVAKMAELGLSKQQLAKALSTSRSQLDRVLDADDTSITLMTMVRVADAVGLDARFDFGDCVPREEEVAQLLRLSDAHFGFAAPGDYKALKPRWVITEWSGEVTAA